MSSVFLALLFAVASLPTVDAATGTFSYDNQSAWGDSCTMGTRQSPIQITSADAINSDILEALEMEQWDVPVSGIIENTGSTVKFTPTTISATLRNHLGLYMVEQFHFHWGENDTVGSEHKVDSIPYAAEVHFVSRKSTGSATSGDAYSVVAVLFEADDTATETGIWAKLVPPVEDDANMTLDDIAFSELLPDNFDYHQYVGSLTTPPCSEVVQWFVLKTPRTIPSTFLQRLRLIQDDFNGTLTKDYRDTQAANGRLVMSFTSGSAGVPVCGVMPVVAALLYFMYTQFYN